MKTSPQKSILRAFFQWLTFPLAVFLLIASSHWASAQIATGLGHTIVVKEDGTVSAWGLNSLGQLGDGTTTSRTGTTTVLTATGTLSKIIDVAAGVYHSVALASDGTVWSWGYNVYGQLGIGNSTQQNNAVQMLPLSGTLPKIVEIAAGDYSTLMRANDGTVWAVGYNAYGQLGIGNTTNQNKAVQISSLSNIKAIAAGANHGLALNADGTVSSWGLNANGQVGNNTTTQQPSPVYVLTASGTLTGVMGLGGGALHSLALKSDGTVCGWGYNLYGQVGDNTTTQRLVATTTLTVTNVASLAAGHDHSVALKNDGTVWSWGYNFSGQLGNGTVTDSHTPIQSGTANLSRVAYISARTQHTMVMRTDGCIYGLGDNIYGAFGNGVAGYSGTPIPISLNGVKAVAGGLFSSLALTTDGNVWAFGQNRYGQLGINSVNDTDVPTQTLVVSNVQAIAVGTYHAAAVKNDGTVWAWGYNSSGQVGDGTNTQRNQPVQVLTASGTLTGVSTVAAGNNHTVALKSDGTVWAWGSNTNGQLGDRSATNRTTAVQVLTASGTLTGITAIAAGASHTVALKNDNTVWVWGNNGNGQLGNNTTTSGSYAIQVLSGTAVTALAAGDSHTVAIKSDGTMLAWGLNTSGQLGDNSMTQRLSPVAVSNITSVASIAANAAHTMAVKTDHTVWNWGSNTYGELGDGTFNVQKVPEQVTGTAASSGTVSIPCDCGGNHCLLINPDLTLSVWGSNQFGQLGNGVFGYSTTPVLASFQNLNTSGLWVDQSVATGSNGTFAHPFKTIAAAVTQSAKVSDTNTRITVRAGTYNEEVDFDGQNYGAKSGTPGNPFIFRGLPGERVVLSGFKPITGWTLDSGNVYVASSGTWNVDTFYVGRNEKLMAQSPNVGTACWIWQSKTFTSSTSSTITDTNHLIGVGNLTGGRIFYMGGAAAILGPIILSNDPVAGTITFSGTQTTNATAPYIIKNCRQIVDQPGEWACIKSGSTYNVYYCTSDTNELISTQARASGGVSRAELEIRYVNNMVVQGLEVEGATGRNGYGIRATQCQNINISWNTLHDNGGYLWTGNNADFYGAGIGLIGISGSSAVSNNLITLNFNGMTVTSCTDTVITNNDIGYNYIDGFDLDSGNNLSTPCLNVTISNNYIHHQHNLTEHADAIQTYETGVQKLNILNNVMLGQMQIMFNGLGGGTIQGNTIWDAHVNNMAGNDGLHYYSNPVTFSNNTIYDALGSGTAMSLSGTENAIYGRLTMHTSNYTGNRNLVEPTVTSGTGYDTCQMTAILLSGVWKNFGYLTGTGVQGFSQCFLTDTGTAQDVNSVIGNPATIQFVNMPTTVRVTNDTSKCVYTSGSTTLSIAQNSTEGTSNNPLGDYAVGNHIEFNMDGVVRTVTAVDTVNITITFTPGLHGPTVGDGLAWVSLPRYDFVENWGTRTNFARDSRLSGTSQGLTMSGTGGPIGSLLIIPNYQADDFDGDGFRDVPILPADVQTNLNAHDFHTATWLSYGTY